MNGRKIFLNHIPAESLDSTLCEKKYKNKQINKKQHQKKKHLWGSHGGIAN